MTFLEKLYILLDNKKMTRNKLVTELNLNKNAVQNWEKQGSKPRAETMRKIADYFNVDMISLIDDDLELHYNSPVGNCNTENGGTKNMAEHNDCITEERYKEMYELASKRVEGLRAMAENIISDDKKIIVDLKTTCWQLTKAEILWLTIIDTEGNVLYDSALAPEYDFNQDFRYLSRRTGIDFDKLSSAPTLKNQLYKINEILLSANTIIGYSAGKIMGYLRQSGFVWRSDNELISLDEQFKLDDADIEELTDKQKAKYEECLALWNEYRDKRSERSTLDNCRAILHCYNRMIEEGYELEGC